MTETDTKHNVTPVFLGRSRAPEGFGWKPSEPPTTYSQTLIKNSPDGCPDILMQLVRTPDTPVITMHTGTGDLYCVKFWFSSLEQALSAGCDDTFLIAALWRLATRIPAEEAHADWIALLHGKLFHAESETDANDRATSKLKACGANELD
jgi:hypothetical protein